MNINRTFFSKEAFLCCEDEIPYFLEEKNLCVKECTETEYKFSLFEEKKCSKFCSKELFLFNSICYINCPKETHRMEDKNICECNNLFYIDEKNNKICLNKTSNCNDTNGYSYLIKNKNQCVKDCSSDDYYKLSFNNICYFKCPKNSKNFIDNKCECLFKFYYKNNELICLDENENCPENYNFLEENSNECLKECKKDNFIFNNRCLLSCENDKKPNGKECICKFKFFYNNSMLNCLNENENCPSNFSYINKENNECLIKCPNKYLIFKNECVKNCPEIIMNLIQLV